MQGCFIVLIVSAISLPAMAVDQRLVPLGEETAKAKAAPNELNLRAERSASSSPAGTGKIVAGSIMTGLGVPLLVAGVVLLSWVYAPAGPGAMNEAGLLIIPGFAAVGVGGVLTLGGPVVLLDGLKERARHLEEVSGSKPETGARGLTLSMRF